MRKVNCEDCGAAYEVDPRRIPASGMKMRCPACGASVHVAPEAAKPEAKLNLADLDLDLPAPKPSKAGPLGAASLPPVKIAAKAPAKVPDLELSDLPAIKPRAPARPLPGPSLSSSAGDDLTDLPAPRQKPAKLAPPVADTQPSPPPKPSLPAPTFEPRALLSTPSLQPGSNKKTAPAKLRPVELRQEPIGSVDLLSDLDFDIDLPAPKAKPGNALDELDLPATRQKPALGLHDFDLGANKSTPRNALDELDLPVTAKPRQARDELDLPATKQKPAGLRDELDLPATKQKLTPAFDELALKPRAAGAFETPKTKPQKNLEETPHGLDLDSPLDRRDVATPKKSFAKPGNPGASPRAVPAHEPAQAREQSSGMLPKDSLAIDPKPFFASAPPLGMFGKLDDIHGESTKNALGNIDLIDLPAPNDLPAVKKPAPKATALGLGARMPKDSLDLPAGFDSRDAPVLPEVLPGRAPAAIFGNSDESSRAAAAAAMSELDLPAPRDLPAVKKRAPAATALGLGSSLGTSNKPASSGGFEVQLLGAPSAHGGASAAAAQGRELSLDLPPMSGRQAPRPEIDLGDFEQALDNLEGRGGGSFGAFAAELDLPPRAPAKRDAPSFGDLEPIALPSAGASNQNTLPLSTMELAPSELMLTGADRGFALSDTGERQQFANAAARRSDIGLELSTGGANDLSSPPSAASRGGDNFGELDLGLGRDSSVGLPLDVPTRRTEQAAPAQRPRIEDAEILDDGLSEAQEKKRKRAGGRKLPAWAMPLILVGVVGGTGTALGMFTEHGYFGVYLMEQLLPAAGDPERVRAAIEQAERQARGDTYVETRRALISLSDARNEAGLNRELLARSLLHEGLYQLRFGEDAQSAQRSAAILTRVLERGTSVPGLTLARAADAARRNDLAEAKRLLTEVPSGSDKYRGLVAGELALLEKQPETAANGFLGAIKQGEVARGQWGLARARLAAGKLDEAEAAAKATLAASPRHPPAHTLVAERALARGAIDVALDHVRKAAGHTAIDGAPARPSRQERARAFALEGRIEEQRDHPREAQAAYEQALLADPRSVGELLGSGRMLMRLGRPQDALSRFDSAVNAKPGAAREPDGRIPLLEAGSGAIQALLALSRAQEALPRSTALLAQFPAEPEVKLWHGHVLEALERYDEAEAAFRETMESAPKSFDGYVALSQLLFKRARPEEAARVLSVAAGQVKDSAEVRRMLGNSELARNHLPEAVTQFNAALKFDGRDPGALYGLVQAQRKAGAMDAASSALDKLEKVDATFPGLALERGQILENRGDYTGAITTYRAALAQRPSDSELKLRLGAALVTAGQVDEAEAVLNQVIKERPTSAEAEHYLGRVLFARNETAQAAQRFERAVNFDILKAEYHLYLAWALVEQGNYGGGLESVQHAIERDPNLADARWILGRIQLRTGAVRDALANFQAALRLKPGRVEALANMGDAYDELRDASNAIKSYQEAVKRSPDNADWWYRLAQLELDKGHREQARAALSEAVLRADKLRARPSWLAEAHRAYGDVLRESKKNAEAADHYRLFLELAPLGHPDRGEIEQLVYQMKAR